MPESTSEALTLSPAEFTPCGRGSNSYACADCYCGLAEEQRIARLEADLAVLRRQLALKERELQRLLVVVSEQATEIEALQAVERTEAAKPSIDGQPFSFEAEIACGQEEHRWGVPHTQAGKQALSTEVTR